MTMHGWIVVLDNRGKVNTISETKLAAMINGLVTIANIMVTSHDTEEKIKKAFYDEIILKRNGIVSPVSITIL